MLRNTFSCDFHTEFQCALATVGLLEDIAMLTNSRNYIDNHRPEAQKLDNIIDLVDVQNIIQAWTEERERERGSGESG
jgi:hypothetical protein